MCACAIHATLVQSTAARLTALLLAAHQPVWSLWCLVSFTNTPLESAALAFLPAAVSRADRQETARVLLLLGAASGVVGSCVAVGLPALAPQLFASNAALWGPMRSVGVQGTLAMLCCGLDVAATGILLGLKDTTFVVSKFIGGEGRAGGPGVRPDGIAVRCLPAIPCPLLPAQSRGRGSHGPQCKSVCSHSEHPASPAPGHRRRAPCWRAWPRWLASCGGRARQCPACRRCGGASPFSSPSGEPRQGCLPARAWGMRRSEVCLVQSKPAAWAGWGRGGSGAH